MFYAMDQRNRELHVFERKRTLEKWLDHGDYRVRLGQRDALKMMARALVNDGDHPTFSDAWRYLQYLTAAEICDEYFSKFGGEVE